VRHVEQVTAPVAEHGARLRVQREDGRHGDRALGRVLEVVAGVETAATVRAASRGSAVGFPSVVT
jgi:hypothetical protein